MTSVVSNATAGLQKKIPKDRKIQSNKSNVVNSSAINDTNQINNNHTEKAKSDSKLQVLIEFQTCLY